MRKTMKRGSVRDCSRKKRPNGPTSRRVTRRYHHPLRSYRSHVSPLSAPPPLPPSPPRLVSLALVVRRSVPSSLLHGAGGAEEPTSAATNHSGHPAHTCARAPTSSPARLVVHTVAPRVASLSFVWRWQRSVVGGGRSLRWWRGSRPLLVLVVCGANVVSASCERQVSASRNRRGKAARRDAAPPPTTPATHQQQGDHTQQTTTGTGRRRTKDAPART